MKRAVTLIELVVTVAIVALLTVISLPAIRALENSFAASGCISTINAGLSAARTIAQQTQNYTGIRFQPDAEGRIFIPDSYTGEIEKRFKHLPRESELKGNKKEEVKEEPKKEVKKSKKK